MTWQPIETAPMDEERSFLVLCAGNEMCETLIRQAAMFEGNIYPDSCAGYIDWEDAIRDATHWQPLPEPPQT